MWCSVWFNVDIPPEMNDLAYSHVQKLARVKYDAERLDEHIKFARQYLADTQGIKRKNVMLGNLVNTYAAWRQSQQPLVKVANGYNMPPPPEIDGPATYGDLVWWNGAWQTEQEADKTGFNGGFGWYK